MINNTSSGDQHPPIEIEYIAEIKSLRTGRLHYLYAESIFEFYNKLSAARLVNGSYHTFLKTFEQLVPAYSDEFSKTYTYLINDSCVNSADSQTETIPTLLAGRNLPTSAILPTS